MIDISRFNDEYFNLSESELRDRKDKLLSYGIGYLDDTMYAIYPKSLIVIGSKTGTGKTEIATQIAMHNAEAGKKIVYFALEAEKYEIQRRIEFKILSGILEGKISFQEFIAGKYIDSYTEQRGRTKVELKKLDSLVFRYRNHSNYTVDDFLKDMDDIRFIWGIQPDLIIIDHLHYFDWYDDDNRAVKSIVKKIRDTVLIDETPIILISHVRKIDKRTYGLVPDIDDFHGTSEIAKVATQAITLAPSYKFEKNWGYKTYMRVLKNRYFGSVTKYIAETYFDITNNKYKDQYILGYEDKGIFEPLTDNEPSWYRRKRYVENSTDNRDQGCRNFWD